MLFADTLNPEYISGQKMENLCRRIVDDLKFAIKNVADSGQTSYSGIYGANSDYSAFLPISDFKKVEDSFEYLLTGEICAIDKQQSGNIPYPVFCYSPESKYRQNIKIEPISVGYVEELCNCIKTKIQQLGFKEYIVKPVKIKIPHVVTCKGLFGKCKTKITKEYFISGLFITVEW